MLIPVPLVRKNAPGADLVRQARIIQENLPRPPALEEVVDGPGNRFGDGLGGEAQPQDVEVDLGGKLALPATCGPKLNLEVTNVEEVVIRGITGGLGFGPMIYTMKNTGEPFSAGGYGYHVTWTVYDGAQAKVIENDHWYSCTGWDGDVLSCTGPNWRKYGSAQMCIYYEDPACPLPVQCFPFKGDDPFPPQAGDMVCSDQPIGIIYKDFSYVDPFNPPREVWQFTSQEVQNNTAEIPDLTYVLKYTFASGATGVDVCSSLPSFIACAFMPKPNDPLTKWELLREPRDLCRPLASEVLDVGQVVVDPGPRTVGAAVCPQQQDLASIRYLGSQPKDTGGIRVLTPIYQHRFDVSSLDIQYYASREFVLLSGSGNQVEATCSGPDNGVVTCETSMYSSFDPASPENGAEIQARLAIWGGDCQVKALPPYCGQTQGWELIFAGAALEGTLPPEWRFGTYSELQDSDQYYVKYDVGGSTFTYDCVTIAGMQQNSIKCKGPNTQDYKDSKINYRIYYKGAGCTAQVYTSSWPEAGSEVIAPAAPDRCELFDAHDVEKLIFYNWTPGSSLTFYIKMRDGVPGLEMKIPGDTDAWNYSAKIGDYSTQNCWYDPNYERRLYCSIRLPSEYAASIRPLSIYVNGCSTPVFSLPGNDLPAIEGPPQVVPPTESPVTPAPPPEPPDSEDNCDGVPCMDV